MKPRETKPMRLRPARRSVGSSAVVVTRWHVVRARIDTEVSSQVSRRSFTGSVSLHPGKMDYQHDGVRGVVSQADLERYAASMLEKGVASSASTDGNHVEISMTARTVAILTGARSTSPKPSKAIRTTSQPTSDHPEPVPVEIPDPNKIMEAVLTAIRGSAVQRTDARKTAASLVDFPTDKIKLALYVPGSFKRTSFAQAFDLVIGHLQKVGAVKAEGKKLVALPMADGNPIPPYETSIKAKARAAQPKTARLREMDVPRLVKSITEQDPYRLLSMWKNAVSILDDRSKRHHHGDAENMVRAISNEWDRRAETLADDAYFKWPTTEARGGRRNGHYRDLREEGMLRYLEYKVGKDGEHSSYRQALLSRIFENALPPVFDRLYLAEWGPNRSSIRLRKMAQCLASFAKNLKHQRNDKYDEAVQHWEQDLEYLHDRYYVGQFGFDWPTT